MIVFGIVTAIVLLFLALRYSFLFPDVEGIPVLMYHDLSLNKRDFLTLDPMDFKQQLEWLRGQGYRSLSMADFLAHLEGKLDRSQLPDKPVLITFDDGYSSNVEHALPVLRQFDFRATLFLTTSYIEERESAKAWQYLSIQELRRWTDAGMEVALHSHAHPNYKNIPVRDVLVDLEKEEELLCKWDIPYHKALAYPFGARPQAATHRQELKEGFTRYGIRAAFRIGNRVQPFFCQRLDRFEVQRIDIRGDQNFFEFKIKVRKGKTKRF
ncbi:MAG: polysaccharide deacetylase family protein [Bdellovibrionales bacterium]|nr:polysaccharide deacetylase family protein [Bdellovibrionales bacterium]